MAMYAIATVPLINRLHHSACQDWYADDAAACDSLLQLSQWWDLLNQFGPSYGYYANATNTHLVVNTKYLSEAECIFKDTSVNITNQSHSFLGSVIGQNSFVEQFVKEKVAVWKQGLCQLSVFAESQPHAAFTVLTHGLIGKWCYMARTTSDISNLLEPLEAIICVRLLSQLTGQGLPGVLERNLFTLPARMGGLSITNPAQASFYQLSLSQTVTPLLVNLLTRQDHHLSPDMAHAQQEARLKLKSTHNREVYEWANQLHESLPDDLKLAVTLAREKGTSSWLQLSLLPSTIFSFTSQHFAMP